MLEKIDGLLLTSAQKVADSFSVLTGLSKFWLEKWFFIASNMFAIIFLVLVFKVGFPYFLISLMLFWTALGTWSIERRERVFLSSGSLLFTPESQPGIRRLHLIINASTTILTLVTYLEFRESLLFYLTISSLFSIAGLYFSACIPRRPSKGLLREWYEKTLWKINDVLIPVGENR